MNGIVIACVSDDESFVNDIYEYFLSALEQQMKLENNKNVRYSQKMIRLIPADNEIQIDGTANIPRGMIKWILQSFLKQSPTRFHDYNVIEFGDAFTIGRILDPSKMEMFSCEICGFFTPYSEEIQTHRMTHFGI